MSSSRSTQSKSKSNSRGFSAGVELIADLLRNLRCFNSKDSTSRFSSDISGLMMMPGLENSFFLSQVSQTHI